MSLLTKMLTRMPYSQKQLHDVLDFWGKCLNIVSIRGISPLLNTMMLMNKTDALMHQVKVGRMIKTHRD